MLLRVPSEYVPDEITRERIGPIPLPVRPRVRPEDLAPVGTVVESIGIIEGVTRFVPQVTHRFLFPLDGRGIVFLNPRKPLVGKVKGHADQRGSVRTAPLVAQVDRRSEIEPSAGKLLV